MRVYVFIPTIESIAEFVSYMVYGGDQSINKWSNIFNAVMHYVNTNDHIGFSFDVSPD